MNILITGHSGFIGSNLCKILTNHNIIGVDIKDGNNILDSNYINNLFVKHNFDAVIHLAAIAGVGYSVIHSEEVLNNNIVGFDILAKAAIKNGVKHFIYASSSSVYGDNGIQKSPYAISKMTNEMQSAMYASISNVKFTGLRFFTVYGNGIRKDLAISKFLNAMENNTTLYVYGDGTQSRDFTYIEDIIEAIKIIVETERQWKNEIFDIGYGESTTINDLILLLKSIINPSFDKIRYINERNYDVKKTLSNTNKLNEWFGFKPKYNIKQGLVKWLKHVY